MPSLLQLYGIVCRITEKHDAQTIRSRYEDLMTTRTEDEIIERGFKEIMDKEDVRFPYYFFGYRLARFLPFVLSYNHMVEALRECRDFEANYAEMEKKGLIQALKLRKKKLHGSLWSFHFAANYIVKETKDIVDKLVTATEMENVSGFDSVFESDVLKKMLELSTRDVFRSASELKKQLENYF